MQRVIGSSRLSNGFFETFMAGAVGRDCGGHKFTITNGAKDPVQCRADGDGERDGELDGRRCASMFAQAEAAGHGGRFVPELADLFGEANGPDLAEEVRKGGVRTARSHSAVPQSGTPRGGGRTGAPATTFRDMERQPQAGPAPWVAVWTA